MAFTIFVLLLGHTIGVERICALGAGFKMPCGHWACHPNSLPEVSESDCLYLAPRLAASEFTHE